MLLDMVTRLSNSRLFLACISLVALDLSLSPSVCARARDASLVTAGLSSSISAIGAVQDPADTIQSSSTRGSSAVSQSSKQENTASGDSVSPKSKADREKAAKKLYAKGIDYKRQNDSGRALIEFLKATKEDPENVKAYYEQALIFREKGFYKLATTRLEQALAINPSFQRARVLLAALQLEQGNVPDAVHNLGKMGTALGIPQVQKDRMEEQVETSGHHDGEAEESPAMILQSLHAQIPLPILKPLQAQEDTAAAEPSLLRPVIGTEPGTKVEETKPSRRIRWRGSSRQKAQKRLEKKYKKYSQFNQSENNGRFRFSHWLARILPWSASTSKENISKPAPESSVPAVAEAIETVHHEHLPQAEGKEKNEKESVNRPARKGEAQLWDGWDHPLEPSPELKEQKAKASSLTFVDKNRPMTVHDDVEHEQSVEDSEAPPKREKRRVPKRYICTDCHYPHAYSPDAHPDSARHHVEGANAPHVTKSNVTDKADQTPEKKAVAFKQSAIGDGALKEKSENLIAQEDEWTKRLEELNRDGTSSLKNGEAFMFSEDSGEAVLFLEDGRKIRRSIAAPKATAEVVKMRRPDTLIPKELMYDTSLLGKIVQTQTQAQQPQTKQRPRVTKKTPAESLQPAIREPQEPPPKFQLEELTDNPDGFVNWLKGLMRL